MTITCWRRIPGCCWCMWPVTWGVTGIQECLRITRMWELDVLLLHLLLQILSELHTLLGLSLRVVAALLDRAGYSTPHTTELDC